MREEKDAFSLLDVETLSRAIKQKSICTATSVSDVKNQCDWLSKENNRAAYAERSLVNLCLALQTLQNNAKLPQVRFLSISVTVHQIEFQNTSLTLLRTERGGIISIAEYLVQRFHFKVLFFLFPLLFVTS